MNLYINECIHHIYGISQLCFILLTSCTKATYDNYNIIEINETLTSNLVTITLELLYWIFMHLPNY